MVAVGVRQVVVLYSSDMIVWEFAWADSALVITYFGIGCSLVNLLHIFRISLGTALDGYFCQV